MKILKRVITVITLSTFVLSLAACNASIDQNETLQLAGGDWESIEVHNQIAGFILEHGYDTEYQSTTLDVPAMISSLSSGALDVNIELWRANITSYHSDTEEGLYHEISTNFVDPGQGIWIPQYLQDSHDINTLQDLLNHHELFEHSEVEEGKGVIFGGPEGWAVTDFLHTKFGNEEYYPGFGEKFEFYPMNSTVTLNTTLQNAYENEDPWVGYHWAPTWPHAAMDLVRLKDEVAYDVDLHESDGLGDLPADDVVVVVRDGFEADYPNIHAFLSNYQTSTEITSEILKYLYDNEDATTENAAIWFFENYEELWTEWIPEDVEQKVRTALESR